MTTPALQSAGTDRAPGLCGALLAAWRAITADRLTGYRPERHYMRGPGPKWHARHAPDVALQPGPALGRQCPATS